MKKRESDTDYRSNVKKKFHKIDRVFHIKSWFFSKTIYFTAYEREIFFCVENIGGLNGYFKTILFPVA